MQLRLSEIAATIGMTLKGDDRLVTGVNTLAAAGPDEVSFLANPKYIGELPTTRAAAVIVHPSHADAVPRALVSENPYMDFGRTLGLFAREQGFFDGISPLAFVHPEAEIGDGVSIGPFAIIGPRAVVGGKTRVFPGCYVGEDCRIGEGCILYPNAVIMAGTVMGRGCIIQPGAVLGSDGFGFTRTERGIEKIPQVGRVVLGDGVEVGASSAIDRAALDVTSIGSGTKIDNLVQIGHNVRMGASGIIVAQAAIAGSCVLGDNVTLAGQVGVAGHLRIGNNVTLGPQSGVGKDIPDNQVMGGSPAVDQGTFMRTLALMPRFPEIFKRLTKLEKELAALKDGQADTKEPS
jgi:UDP-3-O-[3-hydroxymyristoyl] glucosamine N-acyltransferase